MRVTAAKYLGGFRIYVRLSDGIEGTADFSNFLKEKRIDDSVYEPLRHVDFFRKVTLDRKQGTLVWPNDIDIAPDLLSRLLESFKKSVESRYRVVAMPQLFLGSTGPASYYMYPLDTDQHSIPHFHLKTGDGDAVMDLENLKAIEISGDKRKIRGHVSDAAKKLRAFKPELKEAWDVAVAGGKFFKIQTMIASVSGYDVYVYPGDLKQRLVPFVRFKKGEEELFVALSKSKRGKSIPQELITWVDANVHALYENWALALQDKKMTKIKPPKKIK